MLAELAGEAGNAILAHYYSARPAISETKPDSTPVTAADLAAHEILVEGLARFGLPVLSEECAELAVKRREWETFWMVDPLDGTREYLERTGEFSINIALIEVHRATFGLIAVPGTGEVFCGGPEVGAWRLAGSAWRAVRCRSLPETGPLIVLASRRHRGDKLRRFLDELSDLVPDLQRMHSGSAIKFCRLAEGSADIYPRFSPCSEWDTAAGQALLEGAGGAVLSLNGSPLRYNTRDTLLSPNFFALADPQHSLWSKLL